VSAALPKSDRVVAAAKLDARTRRYLGEVTEDTLKDDFITVYQVGPPAPHLSPPHSKTRPHLHNPSPPHARARSCLTRSWTAATRSPQSRVYCARLYTTPPSCRKPSLLAVSGNKPKTSSHFFLPLRSITSPHLSQFTRAALQPPSPTRCRTPTSGPAPRLSHPHSTRQHQPPPPQLNFKRFLRNDTAALRSSSHAFTATCRGGQKMRVTATTGPARSNASIPTTAHPFKSLPRAPPPPS
jgi:hypothetical protein